MSQKFRSIIKNVKSRLTFRNIIFAIAIVGLISLVSSSIPQLKNLTQTIKDINLLILVLAIFPRVFSIFCQAGYFKSIIIHDKKKPWPSLSHIAPFWTMNTINLLVPSGGIAGLKYMQTKLYPETKFSEVSSANFLFYIFNGLAIFSWLVVAFFSLIWSDNIDLISFKIVYIILGLLIVLMLLIILVTIAVDFFKNLTNLALIPVEKLIKKFKPSFDREQAVTFINDHLDQIHRLVVEDKNFLWPLGFAIMGVFADILTIAIVFWSLGDILNIGIIIVAYSFALGSSVGSIFAGGVGIYETVMTTTFVTLGVPFSLALPGTLIYRLVSVWIPIIPGAYYYQQYQNKLNQAAKVTKPKDDSSIQSS